MSEQAPVYLHTDDMRNQNDAKIKRILTVFGIGTLLALALIVAALLWRDATHMNNPNETPSQVIVIAVTLVWGAALIFFWSMKMSPLLSYRRYLKETRQGLSRTVEGIVTRFETDTTFRGGISFYAMVINTGEKNDPEDERLLYWDVRLDRPAASPGTRARIRAHGNDIIGFEALP